MDKSKKNMTKYAINALITATQKLHNEKLITKEETDKIIEIAKNAHLKNLDIIHQIIK